MENQMRYYYCKTCNRAVPTANAVCDGCRRRFINDKTYTKEQVDELINAKEEAHPQVVMPFNPLEDNKLAENHNIAGNGDTTEGEMVCPVCKRTYDKSHSICEVCKMPLQMKVVMEERAGKGTAVEPEVEEKEPKRLYGLDYGQEIEHPFFEMEVFRFINGVEEKGESISVCRTQMPIGRRIISDNNIFPGDADDVEDTILRVSRDNAFLYQEDGKLYIEYDRINHTSANARKSPITVNGVALGQEERRTIAPGDKIICGDSGQSNLSGCIKIEIHALRRDGFSAFVEQKMEENRQKSGTDHTKDIKALKESMAALKEENEILRQKVEENTKSIQKIEDLDLSGFKNATVLFETLESTFTSMATSREVNVTLDQCLNEFLKNCAFKKELLEALNEAQLDLLKRAAFLENNIQSQTQLEPDYAPALLYLGKLMENFAYHRLLPMVRDYNPNQWQKLVEASKVPQKNGKLVDPEHPGFLVLSDMVKPFTIRDVQTGELKYRNKIIIEIARAFTHKQFIPPAELGKIGQAFVEFDNARGYRNDSAHVKLEATLASDLEYVSKADFEIAKKDILGSDFLVKIQKYYKGIYGNREVM